MRSPRELLTLERLHFPQLFLMFLVVLCLVLLVTFWRDVMDLWYRPWIQ